MTVAPDEGMMLLQQQMHRQQITEPEATSPAAGAEIGADLAVMVRLAAAVEANTAMMRSAVSASQRIWELCHVVEMPGAQIGAAGKIDDPDRYGPRQGFYWQVIGVSFVLGAGATSFSVWQDAPNDPAGGNQGTNIILTQTVSGRWEPDDFFMPPGTRLVYTSAGGGLTVGIGKAIEIAADALPGYLGLKLAGRI